MASNIKHIVEPAWGWLFVLAVILVLGAALLAATWPAVEGPGVQVETTH